MTDAPIPPVDRALSVSWNPETAFRRFTGDFAKWWPRSTHSIGGRRVKNVVFETRAGGRIFEEHFDGRRFQWGQVLEWEPPHRVKFTFHPSREPSSAQDVEISFTPEGSGTRLRLVSTKWENWGKKARGARNGYQLGWGYVLNVWAERRTLQMALVDGMVACVVLIQKVKGGTDAAIAKAGGEIPRAG